jgi:hypothetical protein
MHLPNWARFPLHSAVLEQNPTGSLPVGPSLLLSGMMRVESWRF